MNADPMAVQNLFAQAVAITDPNQRQAFVREQCADDAELLRRVEALLAAYDQPKPFFDHPTAQLADLPASAAYQPTDTTQRPGSVVAGRYKLLEAIGEGGMGTVWVAEQTSPVRRKVALKLVKPGMDSRQVLARFDAERQALALMDHPNIAKVFDGGVTEQGRPFFAMEYVKGMPLTEYCDQTRLSLEERLKLFIPICQAVQHAHQKGIIHRDLKPSNVLICLYDGKPVPKVIDFGLAKAMYQPLTEHTLHTGHGLMIGTPLYMSPEQAEHNNLDVDTRTDIYSLGVMLYELLTGTTPLERAQFKEAAFGEILRLIKEVEPPKPSTRVSTNMQRASIAAQRNLEPEQLGRSIRGDLDWIVMKALDKERDRRYESANGLARDLERFLNQEAVDACPPSTVYRLRKQFQKHRAVISTAAAFLLLLCAGAVVSTWQAIRATKAEQIAVTAEATAREQRDKAIENERQAIAAKTAEANARLAEEQARLAESQQRAEADSQRIEAVKQRDEAQRLQQEAVARSTQLQQLTEEQRRAIYASDMNLVRIEAQRGNLQRMREILYQQLPIDHSDLRGFEWYYWYRYLNQAQVVRHFDLPRRNDEYSRPIVLPGGKLVAVPKGSETTLIDLQAGKEIATFPQAIGMGTELKKRGATRAHFAENGRAVFGACESGLAFGISPPEEVARLWDGFSPPEGQLLPSGFAVHEPGQQAREFPYPPDVFSHISFLNISQDGRFVGALGNDKSHKVAEPRCRLLVWDVDTQEVILDHVQTRRLNRFVFNRDGSRVAAYYCQGPVSNLDESRDVVVALDVTENKELGVAQHDDDIENAVWLPDSDRLLVATLGSSGRQLKELFAWDIGSNQLQRVSSELLSNQVETTTSPDGRLIAAGSPGNVTILLIDATTGNSQGELHNEGSEIESFAFNSDGSHLIAFCNSGDVVQWPTSSSDQDRFALRSKPLPPSFIGNSSFEFSSERELLVYCDPLTGISVRSVTGREVFHSNAWPEMDQIEEKLDQAERAKHRFNSLFRYHAKLNSTGRLLALAGSSNSGGVVKLIDLSTGEVQWSTTLDSTGVTDSVAIEFSRDQSTLVVASKLGVFGFDVKTGSKREILANSEQQPYIFSELRQCGDDGQLIVAGLASTAADTGAVNSIDVRDATTGERLYSLPFDANTYQGFMPTVPVRISPNRKKLARLFNENFELWDLPSSRLVFKTTGSQAFFSLDSQRLILSRTGNSLPRPAPNDKIEYWNPAIESVEIVSTEDGRSITAFSLAGDDADEIRISPDGRRLLTLHGKFPNDPVSHPAHARLWDCESGREILDLPIAPERAFQWDLDFDPSGNLLTGGVFSKAIKGLQRFYDGRRVGDERSLWLDATPLSPQEDAQLIATNWVNQLKQQTLFPQQMIETIQKNSVCAPLVRDVAVEMVGRLTLESQVVIDQCLEIINRPNNDPTKYQQALSWAKALEQAEQGSLRTITLVGAAQLRLGQYDQALATLQRREPTQFDSDHQDFRWEQLRRAMEVLCLHSQKKDPMEAQRRAIGLADFVHAAHAKDITTNGIQWVPTTQEALRTQGTRFASSQMAARIRPGFYRQIVEGANSPLVMTEKAFQRMDQDGDGILSEGDAGTQLNALASQGITDMDGVPGISLAEWQANILIASSHQMAKQRDQQTLDYFLSSDRDKDGLATAEEWGHNLWRNLKFADKDQDGALTLEEYKQNRYQQAFRVSFIEFIRKLEPSTEIQLLALKKALNEHPGDYYFLSEQAWILATSPDDKMRNGQQALQDATRACEDRDYLHPRMVDTLAAAYANLGDFDKAVEYAEKAVALVGPTWPLYDQAKARLELYQQKQPFRNSIDEKGAGATSPARLPLFTTDQIHQARRIPGGEPCWSPDGKRLIYARTPFGVEQSYLESLDLTTGETRVLCKGGRFVVCSPIDESLAFLRRPLRSEPPELWLYDPANDTERKLADGIPYRWTRDGMLCYQPWATDQLVCIRPEQLDKPIWTHRGALGPDQLTALSYDGKRYGRAGFGKWSFVDLQPDVALPSGRHYDTDAGRADWSADGRWIAHSTHIDDEYGVWLIDTHTQETRLLAELAAYPRWSPDGKTLALGLRSSNEIVLLDVSSLDALWKEKQAEKPKQP